MELQEGQESGPLVEGVEMSFTFIVIENWSGCEELCLLTLWAWAEQGNGVLLLRPCMGSCCSGCPCNEEIHSSPKGAEIKFCISCYHDVIPKLRIFQAYNEALLISWLRLLRFFLSCASAKGSAELACRYVKNTSSSESDRELQGTMASSAMPGDKHADSDICPFPSPQTQWVLRQ